MYVFSLSSSTYGGFLRGTPCKLVKTEGNISWVEVERNFNEHYKIDHHYEVYNEQLFESLPEQYLIYETGFNNVVKFPMGERYTNYDITCNHPAIYKRDDKVWVYQRQLWRGKTLPYKTKGTVKQNQIGPSVLLHIDGYDYTIEVYDCQLEKRGMIHSLFNK